jgi:hypothetical protein
VLPSVAFDPVRLSVICVLVTGVVTAAAAMLGHAPFGLFLGIGMGLGLLNALLVRRAVTAVTAENHPLKKKMALNSATRLLVITAVGLAIAYIFKPMGLGVVFGLAVFQVILVLSTSLPVLKKLREGAAGEPGQASMTNDG